MSLEKLLQLSDEHSKSREALDAMKSGARLLQIEGLAAAAKGWMLAGAFAETGRAMLVLTYTQEQAERIAEDLPHYGVAQGPGNVLPAQRRDDLRGGPAELQRDRRKAGGPARARVGKGAVVVAPINSALRRTMPREYPHSLLRRASRRAMRWTWTSSRAAGRAWATSTRTWSTGTASSAAGAGIIDVYASNEELPLRIELFGDEVESIRHFDSATQRSIDKIRSALILPAREVLIDEDNAPRATARIRKELEAQFKSLIESGDSESAETADGKGRRRHTRIENLAYFDEIEYYLPYLHPEEVSIFDYLPADAIVVLDEPMQIKSHWEQHEEQMVETLINRAGRGLLLASQQRQHVHVRVHHQARAWPTGRGSTFALLPRPVSWAKAGRERG